MSALRNMANSLTVGQALLLLPGTFTIGFSREQSLGLIQLGEGGME